MDENYREKENGMLVLASEMLRLTNGMCRVGVGPYGFAMENDNPAQIGMVIYLQPDPFADNPQPLEAGEQYQATVKGFRKHGDAPLLPEDVEAFVDSPADCAFESFSYVADMAYEQKTGHRFLPDAVILLDAGVLESIHADIRYAEGMDRLRTGKEITDVLLRLCGKFHPGQDVAADWPEWLPAAQGTSWGSMKM